MATLPDAKLRNNTTFTNNDATNLGESLASNNACSEHPKTFCFEEFVIEGFEHIFLRAWVHGFARDLDIRDPGHDDDRNAGMLFSQMMKRRQPACQRHIEKDSVNRASERAVNQPYRPRLAIFGFDDNKDPNAQPLEQ